MEAARDEIFRLATDFSRTAELSDIIVSSRILDHPGGAGTGLLRRRLDTRTCLLVFCYDAVLVEDVRVSEQAGLIRTEIVPGTGDFSQGRATWRFTAVDDARTLIKFNSRFTPDFTIVPVIGPLIIKRVMLDSTQESILNMERIARGGG